MDDFDLWEARAALRQAREALLGSDPPDAPGWLRGFDDVDLAAVLDERERESDRRARERARLFDPAAPAREPVPPGWQRPAPGAGEAGVEESPYRIAEPLRAHLRRLLRLEPPPVLTGTAALTALGLRYPRRAEIDLVWRDRERLGGDLVRAVSFALECDPEDVLGTTLSEREHVLRAQTRSRSVREWPKVRVRLRADPRPPVAPARAILFKPYLATTDHPRTVLADLLERLARRPEPQDVYRLELCLKSGADLEGVLADLAAARGRDVAGDLAASLPAFCERLADESDPLPESDGAFELEALAQFVLRLQRRLLDFA